MAYLSRVAPVNRIAPLLPPADHSRREGLFRAEKNILRQESALARDGTITSAHYTYTPGPDGRLYITGATVTGPDGHPTAEAHSCQRGAFALRGHIISFNYDLFLYLSELIADRFRFHHSSLRKVPSLIGGDRLGRILLFGGSDGFNLLSVDEEDKLLDVMGFSVPHPVGSRHSEDASVPFIDYGEFRRRMGPSRHGGRKKSPDCQEDCKICLFHPYHSPFLYMKSGSIIPS